MVEPIMYFGIGFLVAALLGLILLPLVHNRAVGLTVRRLEAATPLSMAEIQADKDQLRAEFAMSTRRLEMTVEQLRAKSTNNLSELAKKTEAINRLKIDLGEKTATILALEAREKALKEQIRVTEQEFSVKTNTMHEAERALADKETDLAKLTAELSERTVVSDSQRVEIVALRTQVEALKTQLDRCEKDVAETEDRLHRQRTDAEAAAAEVSEERGKVEDLGNRVGQLERQLVAQTTEAEILGRRVQELERRLTDQGRLLVERDYELTQLRAQIETARKIEADLRTEYADSANRHSSATENLRAEKLRLETELGQVRDERTRLQHEIAAMKRDAEASWATERVENALLRERINDIAAQVARLTVALEGPGSPIEAILADDESAKSTDARGVNGTSTTPNEPDLVRGDLADRIRALQGKASRAAPVA